MLSLRPTMKVVIYALFACVAHANGGTEDLCPSCDPPWHHPGGKFGHGANAGYACDFSTEGVKPRAILETFYACCKWNPTVVQKDGTRVPNTALQPCCNACVNALVAEQERMNAVCKSNECSSSHCSIATSRIDGDRKRLCTEAPTKSPTKPPTKNPTKSPTKSPTKPTPAPTKAPTENDATYSPTKAPTPLWRDKTGRQCAQTGRTLQYGCPCDKVIGNIIDKDKDFMDCSCADGDYNEYCQLIFSRGPNEEEDFHKRKHGESWSRRKCVQHDGLAHWHNDCTRYVPGHPSWNSASSTSTSVAILWVSLLSAWWIAK